MTEKGKCKHGEFILTEGCPHCIAEKYTKPSTGDAPPSLGSTTVLPIVQEVQTFVIDKLPKVGFTQTALMRVQPEDDIQVQAFYNESLKAKEYAEARVIITADDLAPATTNLSLIAKLKKAMEEKRKDYVKPLQEHIKETNDAFKKLMEPIETADSITRQKILAFQLKQKLIREEQEKINALRLEAAKKEMELKGELTESVNLVEVTPEIAKRTQTDMGSSGMRDNWRWEVVDFSQVPDAYKVINAGVLTPIVKASKGVIVIPGIRVFNEPILAVNIK